MELVLEETINATICQRIVYAISEDEFADIKTVDGSELELRIKNGDWGTLVCVESTVEDLYDTTDVDIHMTSGNGSTTLHIEGTSRWTL